MKLNLLLALAAGVGALVGPQPQLKKVQSLAFAPALDVCDDIDAMRVDVLIEGRFHHRFYQCKDAWESRLEKKRREREALARRNGKNPVETNDATVQKLDGEISILAQILAVSCAVLERDLRVCRHLAPQRRRLCDAEPVLQPKNRDPHTRQTRNISLPRDRWESKLCARVQWHHDHRFNKHIITLLPRLAQRSHTAAQEDYQSSLCSCARSQAKASPTQHIQAKGSLIEL